jgi:hypothetical protein
MRKLVIHLEEGGENEIIYVPRLYIHFILSRDINGKKFKP